MAKSQELVKPSPTGSSSLIVPLDEAPNYLPEKIGKTGLEAFNKDDYKTPRILLLQPLSPQITSFPGVALPNNYWHTGMNVPLGVSFEFIPAVAAKRVILWRPRDDNNGGILAFSKNGLDWNTGGNQEFRVKLKGKKEPVVWKTGSNVLSSRLTEFGTADPEDPSSPPAATISYEYLCYLPSKPELSPCVLAVSKTGAPQGKQFNTALAMQAKAGRPIWCLGIRATVQEENKNGNKWTVPNFTLIGYASKDTYEAVKKVAETYADYNIEYDQEKDAVTLDDAEIPF
jgi:hypothetical protein